MRSGRKSFLCQCHNYTHLFHCSIDNVFLCSLASRHSFHCKHQNSLHSSKSRGNLRMCRVCIQCHLQHTYVHYFNICYTVKYLYHLALCHCLMLCLYNWYTVTTANSTPWTLEPTHYILAVLPGVGMLAQTSPSVFIAHMRSSVVAGCIATGLQIQC